MHLPSLAPQAGQVGRASVIVIGGSLGGYPALLELLEPLPADLPVPVLIAQHIAAPSRLPETLSRRTPLRVSWAENFQTLRPGHVYIAPPRHHLLISGRGRARAQHGDKVNFACPAMDPLFYSAARHYGSEVIAVTLSGRLHDGVEGARAVSRAGGIVIAQDLDSCLEPEIPTATIAATHTPLVLPPTSIGHAIVALTMVRGAEALLGVDGAARVM